ncbi:MAG: NAD-dependent epimerase/dehydratase family protein [Candidatus Ryanbacteria bacterium]|nr:NAD-dependent epimerase/dehydratase family protein [Candidatus Ryanbacteria bacterium]
MSSASRVSLVTGAGGFVGANLVRRLVSQGERVHTIIRADKPSWRLADIADKIIWHKADLRDKDVIRAIAHAVQPEIIYHLATAGVYAGVHVSDSEMIENNILGFINLLDAVRDLEYQCFVNTGSSAEYGQKQAPMHESDICEPATMYGISKLAATHYAALVAQKESKSIITLRLFSPYGPYDDKSRLMSYAIARALRGESLALGDAQSVRDFVYIDDVVDAYIQCGKNGVKFGGEVLNIAGGREYSVGTVVENIVHKTKSSSACSWKNDNAKRAWESSHWQADISKAKKILNWEPKISLDRGLDETIAWFQKNPSFYEGI